MTKKQFEKQYAENSKLPLATIHSWGRGALPCDCGEKICKGWQMVDLKLYELDLLNRAGPHGFGK